MKIKGQIYYYLNGSAHIDLFKIIGIDGDNIKIQYITGKKKKE